MTTPWPSELLPEGALLGFAMAVGGGLLGGWTGARLASQPAHATGALRSGALRAGAVVGAAIVAVLVVFALHKPADQGVSATVRLTDVQSGPERTVNAAVTLSPRDAADDAEWINVTAWQGGGLVVNRLQRVGEGQYRTTEPIPVHGEWKALLRLHHGDSLTAVPIFLPLDSAIPAPEVPAERTFTRPFVSDHEILQREQKSAAGALTAIAYGVVAAIALGLLALLVWGLHRLSLGDRAADLPRFTRRSGAGEPHHVSAGTA
jgi:hypothetical protein